jgi:hypothetical protein
MPSGTGSGTWAKRPDRSLAQLDNNVEAPMAAVATKAPVLNDPMTARPGISGAHAPRAQAAPDAPDLRC